MPSTSCRHSPVAPCFALLTTGRPIASRSCTRTAATGIFVWKQLAAAVSVSMAVNVKPRSLSTILSSTPFWMSLSSVQRQRAQSADLTVAESGHLALKEAPFYGPGSDPHARAQLELSQDALDVPFDGADRPVKPRCDLLVREAGRDQAGDLQLASREMVVRPFRALLDE